MKDNRIVLLNYFVYVIVIKSSIVNSPISANLKVNFSLQCINEVMITKPYVSLYRSTKIIEYTF